MVGSSKSRNIVFLIIVVTALVLGGCSSDPGTATNDAPDNQDDGQSELTVQISSGPDSLTNETSAEFELLCNRDAGCDYLCSLDGADRESCQSPVTYDTLEDGDHEFRVVATDEHGEESAPKTWEWTVDTEVPAIVDLSGPASVTNETTATFEFSCSKDDCTFECSLDGANYSGCNSGISYSDLDDGNHVFSVRPTDNLETVGEAEDWEWLIDTESPLVLDLVGPDDPTNETDATFEFVCSEDDCDIECDLNGGGFEPCDSPVNYADLDDGEHQFSAQATNDIGTTGPATEWQWTIDTVEPVVENLSGPEDPTNDISATFDFECSKQDCDFVCELGGQDQGTVASATSCDPGADYSNLNDDDYVFTVYATDLAGNQGDDAVWEWTIDTVVPDLTITDQPDAELFKTAATVEFECSNKPDCSFECALDYDEGSGSWTTGSWEACSSPHTMSDLDAGDYLLNIRATDTVGHEVTESIEWTVMVEGWSFVAAAVSHSCAVANDGTLWCWGSGWDGRLGTGDTDNQNWPAQVGDESDWSMVSGRVAHTCGVRDDGTLWCWGRGSSGRLGLGINETDDQLTPQQVGDDTNWSSVSTGSSFTCGIRDDNTLWCWGWNGFGQLGLGDYEDQHVPQQVTADSDWVDLSADGNRACGLRDDDTLWCWGQNSNGQLGLGNTDQENTPHQVGTDAWAVIDAGFEHTCGVRDDGTLWCWGVGDVGQLGLDNTDDYTSPQQVGTDDDWIDVSGGGSHTCGVRDDDTLWCWGSGLNGRLGVGDTDGRTVPEQVGADSDWQGLSVGGNHSCSLRNDETLWCWGNNQYGRLGLGDTMNRHVPASLSEEQ